MRTQHLIICYISLEKVSSMNQWSILYGELISVFDQSRPNCLIGWLWFHILVLRSLMRTQHHGHASSGSCIIRVSYFPDDGYEIVPKPSRHPEKNVRVDQSREYLVRLNLDWILCSIVDSIAPFVERQPLSTVRWIVFIKFLFINCACEVYIRVFITDQWFSQIVQIFRQFYRKAENH
jgi:hypothetical protein